MSTTNSSNGVAIIGHGPSVCLHEYGKEIDSHDAVVRIKRCWVLLERPDIYGSRVDYAVGSCTIGSNMRGPWKPKEYWLFNDTRTEHFQPNMLIKMFYPEKCVIDTELCKYWREHYRKIRREYSPAQSQERKGHLSDEKGHKHPSAGMHAIIYTLDRLRPEYITLYGFDALLSGEHSWSVTRGPDWSEYPDHNWPTEQLMLNDVLRNYGYSPGDMDGDRLSLIKEENVCFTKATS